MELTADYLEAFLTLSRVGIDRLYGFRPRTYMEVLKGFSQAIVDGRVTSFMLDWTKPRSPWSAFPRLGDCGGVGGNVLNDHSLFSYYPFLFYI